MAIKNASYVRTFISQTDEVDTSMHGSPTWEDYQKICDEDSRLRQEIANGFAFNEERKYFEGFDGKILYSFAIRDNVSSLKNDSKNAEYETKIFIKKAGDEKDLESWSDLEKFLIKNGFNKLK